MPSESRPICVRAMPSLKQNSTRLMVVMCIGIALSLYGIYIQMRNHSMPGHMPSVSVASSWLYHNIGQHIMSPSFFITGGTCIKDRIPRRPSFGQMFMHRFVHPTMRYSAIINGFINVSQIILLRIYARSVSGTDTIIGLSAFGIAISLICLLGSFAFCKLMCISCSCVHHVVIIYLAIRRRRMVQNLACPSGLSSATCGSGSIPKSGGGGGGGSSGGGAKPGSGGSNRSPMSGGASSISPAANSQQPIQGKTTNTYPTRRNTTNNNGNNNYGYGGRRRSNRS